MTQYEAVIKVMEKNGGVATLGHLYQEAEKVKGVAWNTKTPDANIRRIVQVHDDKFFKIRPGLWALLAWKNNLPTDLQKLAKNSKNIKQQQLFDHSYYQGLILEIGNLQKYKTYVPAQDKNRLFLGQRKLSSLATCQKIYDFSYEKMMKQANTVDVIWFNERKMPAALFEVEHTTDMLRSMTKFNELRDFRTKMYIVSHNKHQRKFEDIKNYDTFRNIKTFVKFLGYDKLSKDHSKVHALNTFGPGIQGLYAKN